MIDTGHSLMRRDPQIRRAPNSAGLYDILDLILDKGLVVDAFVRVSLVGIELLTIDARVVIASVDTYLRYAEGAERLQLYDRAGAKRLSDIAKATSKGSALKTGIKEAGHVLEGRKDDDDEQGESEEGGESQQHQGMAGTLAKGVRNVVGKFVDTVTGSEEQEQRPQQQQRQPERHKGNGAGMKSKAGARR